MFILYNTASSFNSNQIVLHKYTINNSFFALFLINFIKRSRYYDITLSNFKINKIIWSYPNNKPFKILVVSKFKSLILKNVNAYKTNLDLSFNYLNYKLHSSLIKFNRFNSNSNIKVLKKSITTIFICNFICRLVNKNSSFFIFLSLFIFYFKLKTNNFVQKSNFFKLQLGYNLRINNVSCLTSYNWTLI